MKIAKWGNSLAVRFPKEIVEALDLRNGAELDMSLNDENKIELGRRLTREEAIQLMRALKRPLPPGYKFDRTEANER